jgi:hemerythrin-like domain-containing protein
VDFIRTYADRCHHGKEEDILFRELRIKRISPEHEDIMKELIEEHVLGRKITAALFTANERYSQGEKSALREIKDYIQALTEFYPRHIAKEDKHFFIPILSSTRN